MSPATTSNVTLKTCPGVLRASLTGEAKRHLASAPTDGSFPTVTRFILGSCSGFSSDMQWQLPSLIGSDVTWPTDIIFMGTVKNKDITVEQANASTLGVRCKILNSILDSNTPLELVIFARINNPPSNSNYLGREIPFASVKLQPLYRGAILHIIIPLGSGKETESTSGFTHVTINEGVPKKIYAIDTLTVTKESIIPPIPFFVASGDYCQYSIWISEES